MSPLGPKKFAQNFSCSIKIRCYFMKFLDWFIKKSSFLRKSYQFEWLATCSKMTGFLLETLIFNTRIQKVHKTTSNFYWTRKILSKIFWSQGTHLGYMGSLTPKCSVVLAWLLSWSCGFTWENQLLLTTFTWAWDFGLYFPHSSVECIVCCSSVYILQAI